MRRRPFGALPVWADGLSGRLPAAGPGRGAAAANPRARRTMGPPDTPMTAESAPTARSPPRPAEPAGPRADPSGTCRRRGRASRSTRRARTTAPATAPVVDVPRFTPMIARRRHRSRRAAVRAEQPSNATRWPAAVTPAAPWTRAGAVPAPSMPRCPPHPGGFPIATSGSSSRRVEGCTTYRARRRASRCDGVRYEVARPDRRRTSTWPSWFVRVDSEDQRPQPTLATYADPRVS